MKFLSLLSLLLCFTITGSFAIAGHNRRELQTDLERQADHWTDPQELNVDSQGATKAGQFIQNVFTI
jgi:hypothetical protein